MVTRRRIFTAILFQIQIFFTAGLSLYPASDLTVQSFTLVCDLEGTSLTNTIVFDYNGTNAGGCSSPSPTPTCGSSIGTVTAGSQTVNFTLNQNEILNKGNALWTCYHGTVPSSYNAVVISYCQNKKVEYKDEKIVLSCSCGFPLVTAHMEYKDGEIILRKEALNLTSRIASCSPDARAMDFLADIADFPPDTAEACATMKSGNEATNPICTAVGCGTNGELFMCGFSLFLIELAVFIVIMILLMLKKMGGFTKMKIVVSCVFLLVALIIGIILGVVLMECSKKNLSLGLGIGLGCMLASAHFVTIYVIHKKNDSKKDDKDKERQGTPVSTSNVKVTSEKAPSHGNPASKNGNVIVSLPNEPIRPLPVPPATRKNQLEPLSVENDGATSPEKKKKKKKKKKRKNTESTDAPEES